MTPPDDDIAFRMALHAGVESGHERLGHGTRAPFVAGEGGFSFEVLRVPPGRVGAGVAGDLGASTDGRQERLWMGIVEAVRMGGATLDLAVGLGAWVGERPSSNSVVRAYPLALALLRAPIRGSVLGLEFREAPITTDSHRLAEAEVRVSRHHVSAGPIARLEWFTSGDPLRTYSTLMLGGAVGGNL